MSKFKQIAVGEYTFQAANGELMQSHSVYALDDDGQIWKYINQTSEFIKIEDVEIKSTDRGFF